MGKQKKFGTRSYRFLTEIRHVDPQVPPGLDENGAASRMNDRRWHWVERKGVDENAVASLHACSNSVTPR